MVNIMPNDHAVYDTEIIKVAAFSFNPFDPFPCSVCSERFTNDDPYWAVHFYARDVLCSSYRAISLKSSGFCCSFECANLFVLANI